MKSTGKRLSAAQQEELIGILKARFDKYPERHSGISWIALQARLEAHPDALWSLYEMEQSGGEPDVVAYDKKTGTYTFFDCSAESPRGRRSLCYDRQALNARKEHKPAGTASDQAKDMGVALLTEEQYRMLQDLGAFDTKTSSWIRTPEAVRKHGGALFCDRRYDHVFTYHNGAESYYAARGFRAALII